MEGVLFCAVLGIHWPVPVITEGGFISPPDAFRQSAAFYLQTPLSDAHAISNTLQINHSMPDNSTVPYSTENYDGSIGHHGSYDQTYRDLFCDFINLLGEDSTSEPNNSTAPHSTENYDWSIDHGSHDQTHDLINPPNEESALEKAKKDTDPQYHGGLEIMQNYESLSNLSVNLKKISLAVQAGYAIIRPDLINFTETILFRWLWNGLWPTLNSMGAESDDIKVQCSEDMRYLGIEKDPETKTMLCCIAWIQLYYWYEEEKGKMWHSQVSTKLDWGIDIQTRTIDVFLEYFFADWTDANKERRKYLHSWFHIEKNMGKRWCKLVQYLGEGILVICGKEMDTQMYTSSDMSYKSKR